MIIILLINGGIPQCHYANAEVHKERFHLIPEDSNSCREIAELLSTLWWLF